MHKAAPAQRLDYIDWLRVFAVLLLIPFHTGMIFVHHDFHIKNDVLSTGLSIMNAFIDNWHMPLFFLLAGTSTFYALGKRSPGEYVKERSLRLLVPLIFGTLVIVPPQTYCERIQKNGFSGSYPDFYTHLFNGVYPQGNFTWNHLWFLVYLFLISMCILPFILRFISGKFQPKAMLAWLVQGRRLFLLSIPLAAVQMALYVSFPGPQNLFSDWTRILFMLIIFFYGALFHIYPAFNISIQRNMRLALIGGISILLIFLCLHVVGYAFVFGYNTPYILHLGLKSLGTWCWLIAFVGFARKYLNFGNGFLEYAKQAAMPFYIVHQTVIIIIGFYIVQTPFAVMSKFMLINILSFIFTLAVYELFIKRFGIVRFLFGMRPQAPRKA